MKRTEFSEDLSTILFLVPFLASGVYAIYLWVQRGFSITLPPGVYLSVTRDPYIFLAGALGVMGGLLIEVATTEPANRSARLVSLSGTLQKLAAASFILAILAAVYANGLSLTGTANDLLVGRYSLVFPAMIVLLSYLIVTPVSSGALHDRRLWGIVAMLLVPATVYEVGKRNVVLGLSISLVLIAVGVFFFTFNRVNKKETASA